MDPFQEVVPEEWPSLQKKNFIFCCWLNTRLQWLKKSSGSGEYSFHILAPDGDVRNGIISFGRTGVKAYYMTLCLFDQNREKMEKALLTTGMVNWDENLVCGVPTGHQEWFKEILERKGYKVHHDTPTDYFIIPKDVPQTYTIECPNDVYVDLLTEKDVLKINTLWQHKFDGSDSLILECIKMNHGYGVYSKESNDLLAWIIKFEYGDVSILQTEEKFRRKGYAKLVVQSICKRMSDDGEDMLVFIVPGNTSSERLFKELGSQYIGSYNWIEYDKK